MDYEQFQNELQQELEGKLSPGTEICPCQIIRNNGVPFDALKLRESEAFPYVIIYPNEYYGSYKEGKDIPQIADQITALHQSLPSQMGLDLETVSNLEQVKDKILFKLVHFEKNAFLLADMPHLPYLDLAIVFYIAVDMPFYGMAGISINNTHLSLWGVDADTLWACAKKNTPLVLPPTLKDMAATITELAMERTEEALPWIPGMPKMLILSNKKGFLGASVILYDGLLEEIANQFQDDYYILPSSTHEVILLMSHDPEQKNDLEDMINSVNESEVDPTDILSDHPYYFDRSLGRLIIP